MTDSQILAYNGDLTVHEPRPGDRVCVCGHPEYCHNPEVPLTFPHDPTDLCVGAFKQHHPMDQPPYIGTRCLPFDPIRFVAFCAALHNYYIKHDSNKGPMNVIAWSTHIQGHVALVCECRSFRLKEEAHAEATASVE